MNQIVLILGIVVSLISVMTFIGGIFAYQRSSARKEYASERDFGHLKNSMAQSSKNIEELWRQNDNRFDHVDQRLTEIAIRMNIPPASSIRAGHKVGTPPDG